MDEVVEVDVEGEILVAGVLVGFGWVEAHVMSVGAEGAEGAAMIVFGGIAAVVDGEDLSFFEL